MMIAQPMTTTAARRGFTIDPIARPARPQARIGHEGGAPAAPPRWRAWLDNWIARRRLARCAALDPRFARDIGLTPEQVHVECHAPFWVPLPRFAHDRCWFQPML